MASPDDQHKSISIHLVIAIILAIFIFLNVLLGIVYLLIPKDCINCHGTALHQAAESGDSEGGFYHRGRHNPYCGYEMRRSIYISGSEGQQVTIINGIVEVDDDFDAWAYWATDSEETLRGIPLNTQHQHEHELQSQYGMYSQGIDAASGTTPSRTTRASEYNHRHSHGQGNSPAMELTSDGIITRTAGSRGLILDLAGYESEPPMESIVERVVTRAPLARSIDVFPPPPQTPSTVRTWGRDSDATIRAVVESPRREVAGAKEKRYSAREGEEYL
ncbi:hypothetical protein ACHAQJ_000751 [Trichoderma viride]